MAKIPDKAEHQRQFAGLDTDDRRAIIKAVNRGKPVDKRKHAHLAVGVARKQQRFWRWAWLVGPVVGLSSFIGDPDPMVAAINAVVATLALGLMSVWWYTRARRAEVANTELARAPGGPNGRTSTSADRPAGRSGQRTRAHLPARTGGTLPGGSAADASPGSRLNGGPDSPPGQRPYRPRGRKRR